jgi:hypothetical protein
MATGTQTTAAELSFVVLKYHPRPGDQVTIGFAAFDATIPPFRIVMMRGDYWNFVTVLGYEEDARLLGDIMNQFSQRFLNSARPDHAIREIKRALREEKDIFELSDVKIASGPTTGSVVDALSVAYLDRRECRA